MRFDLGLAALALMVTSEAAATKIVFEQTITTVLAVRTGFLQTDDGHIHNIGWLEDGCYSTKHNFVKELCLDGKKSRAHIYWTNQPGKKYCFKLGPSTINNCGKWQNCGRWEYHETKCT